MKTFASKLIALFLSTIVAISFAPFTALAEESDGANIGTTKNTPAANVSSNDDTSKDATKEENNEGIDSSAKDESGDDDSSKTEDTRTSLSSAKVTLSKTYYVYSGKACCPTVKSVTVGGKTVAKKNYAVTYKNNTKSGTATVIVTANSTSTKYKGTVKKKFYISTLKAQTYIAGNGWNSKVWSGYFTGSKSGKSVRGIFLTKYSDTSGNIICKVNRKGIGWSSSYTSSGKTAGDKKNDIQAIKIKLTGELAKHYDVYYQVYVGTIGWMDWAKNGGTAGSTGMGKSVTAMRVKLVLKGSSAPGQTAHPYFSSSQSNGKEIMYRYRMRQRIWNMSSKTDYLITIDTHVNRLAVFKGSKGNWKCIKFWRCCTGAAGTPTPKGSYVLSGWTYHFGEYDGYTCWYASSFLGDYMIHSILYNAYSRTSVYDGRMGYNCSHGCVRLWYNNAKWIYFNMPRYTKVYIK